MSLGAFRRPRFAFLALALAIVAGVMGLGVWGAQSVSAAPIILSLGVGVDRPLSLLGETVSVSVSGQLGRSVVGDKLVIRVEGPAQVAQIESGATDLPEAAKVVQTLGPAPVQTPGPASTTDTTSTSTTVVTVGGGPSLADLETGRLEMSVPVTGDAPTQPGAYLVVAQVKSGNDVVAQGQAWIGKAAPRTAPLDLAFVWPVALGIHRDPAGAFFDTALEQAVVSSGDGENVLSSLPNVCQRFPSWNVTLAVEPVLLTQLRDMADGYTRADAAGKQTTVGPSDPAALGAAAAVAALAKAAALGSVEVVASPYSGADLGVLAAEDWRDGFEQIQLGKQELSQTLGLGGALVGGYSPDLSLTSGSLASYAQASIDHVVVSDALAKLLTEPLPAGAVAARARDAENDRVTLVFANSDLSAVTAAPWDAGALFAAIAAELASAPRDALVITPGTQFVVPPQSYLESIGETLADLGWVRTQTLTGVLRAHSPGTRPVMLNANPTAAQSYIESALLDSLRTAHTAVMDLAAAADPTRAQVDEAHRLLYMAESRWWWRPQTTPQEATIGLHYSEAAQQLATGELGKVSFAGVSPSTINGNSGKVTLLIDNGTGYPITATLQLTETGLILPGGPTQSVELQPGRTSVAVDVTSAEGPHKLDAQLVAGSRVLDEIGQSLRFITLRTLLPAILVGGAAILAGLYLLARRLQRRFLWRSKPRGRPMNKPTPSSPAPPPPGA